MAVPAPVILGLLVAASCSNMSGPRVVTPDQLATIEPPASWDVGRDASRIYLRHGVERIDVMAAPLDDNGRPRKPAAVAEGLKVQVQALRNARLGGVSVHQDGAGSRVLVEWTDTVADVPTWRRHWAVFTSVAIVHVSCAAGDNSHWDACDSTAMSSRGNPE